MSHTEIDALLTHSRRNNIRHEITGVLLHTDGSFLQVLEGPQERVNELWDRIVADTRHTRITQIIFEAIPRRFFGDQTMALSTLSSAELAGILGSPDSEHHEVLLTSLDEGRAKKLLRAFAEGRWRRTLKAVTGVCTA